MVVLDKFGHPEAFDAQSLNGSFEAQHFFDGIFVWIYSYKLL